MNLLVAAFVVVIAMCDADPARFPHFQRQSSSNAAAAPYPPSGYRPAGAQFPLPQQTYGAPPQSYGPPPPATTTELPETTTTNIDDSATTTEPQAETIIDIRGKKTNGKPLLLVVPRRQTQTQNYVTYAVEDYPQVQSVQVQAEEDESASLVAFAQNGAIYTTGSKLQALPIANVYNPNPYAYFQIYQ